MPAQEIERVCAPTRSCKRTHPCIFCESKTAAILAACHIYQRVPGEEWANFPPQHGPDSVLHRISNDASECFTNRLLEYTCRAQAARRCLYGKVSAAPESFRLNLKLLQLAKRSSERDRNATTYVNFTTSGALLRGRAGDLHDLLVRQAHVELKTADDAIARVAQRATASMYRPDPDTAAECDDAHTHSSNEADRAAPRDGPGCLSPSKESHYHPQVLTQPQWEQLLNIGMRARVACDACGAIRKLRKCERCGYTWYCTIDCQRKAWKERHQRECRPAGQLKPGDMVCVPRRLVRAGATSNHGFLRQPSGPKHWLVHTLEDMEQHLATMMTAGALPAHTCARVATAELTLEQGMFRLPANYASLVAILMGLSPS